MQNRAIAIFLILFSFLACRNHPSVQNLSAGSNTGNTPAPLPHRALILYDDGGSAISQKLAIVYSIMLESLLGHFSFTVERAAISTYAAKQIEAFDVSFYLGSTYQNPTPLPTRFLDDVFTTSKRFVWFKYGIDQLAAHADLSTQFGITFQNMRGMNAIPSVSDPSPGFFDTVLYKGKSMIKFYSYDSSSNMVSADPDVGVFQITDSSKATEFAQIKNSKTNEIIPYAIQSGKFWYVADVPLSFIGQRDRYLVLCDLLHDMVGINHPENHQALVRLEDVSAAVDFSTMKTLSDFLSGANVPFSIATIPFYRDPLGSYHNGVPEEYHLSNATQLKNSLNYALAHGGSIVAHGYTHQYGSKLNPQTGVSGDDYEFWDTTQNSPVNEDSESWVLNRLDASSSELIASNFFPFAWEAPHYLASPLDYRAFTKRYDTTYQRVQYFSSETPVGIDSNDPNRDLTAGLYFPFLIYSDHYGQRVIPENIGSFNFDSTPITWQTILGNAEYAMVVRDGFASFFFHPFWLEAATNAPTAFSDFQSLITGIQALGYRFIAAPTLAAGIVPGN